MILLITIIADSSTNPLDNLSVYPENSLYNNGNIFPFSGDLPSPRVLHTVCCSNEFVFVYGGFSNQGMLLGDMNLYDIKSQMWSGPLIKPECCNEVG